MIYHLARTEDWEKALDNGEYEPPGFKEEGFIHCSSSQQLQGVLDFHFSQDTQLIILEIADKRVMDHLKWEASRDGEKFPHIYKRLRLDEIENTQLLYRKNINENWEKA